MTPTPPPNRRARGGQGRGIFKGGNDKDAVETAPERLRRDVRLRGQKKPSTQVDDWL